MGCKKYTSHGHTYDLGVKKKKKKPTVEHIIPEKSDKTT